MCNNSVAQVQEDDNSTFTLNLQNTDIHSLISTVSKQTGTNFVVDPRVKAKVTVISTDPVSAEGLYEVFLSVLQVHGYSAVPAGDLIKIVPDVTAKQGPVPILGEDSDTSDQLVTQVITVVNVPAAQLVPILRPMVPQQGHLAAYAATNSLIITDRASNIHRLMEIIRRIDRPDNEEIEVVRLNHASASEIVGTLSSLQRNNIGGPQGPGAMQLVADERTNSVLISGDTAVRVRVRGLIAHLDTPIESGGNTRVIYLKFANAEDMVAILQGVSQGQARVGATTADGNAAPQQTFTQQQPNPNAGQQQGANPAVVNNTQTNAVAARSAAETGESNVDIQADPNTNSLIITAPQDEMQNILAVIRQLDIRRAQVLVEAVIAEITEDNTREFGINFLLDGTDKDIPIGFSNLGGATDGLLGIAGAIGAGTTPASLGAGLSLALGRFDTGEIDFGLLVRAIASDADNNILSTPSIVTLDNEEAEIVVGSNVPFVTGTQLSANNNNPFQTIEREDIGLTLRVTPQINDGNTIKMDLEQEVSNVNTTALTGAADITTNVRSIRTTVLVEDGQTLVLGGLIDDQVTDVEERVPLLGDIPVLGHLFRYRATTKNKRNLMIFLHPKIIRDSETASQFSNSKYNFIRKRQQDNAINKEKPDALPELKIFFEGRDADSPLTQFDSPRFDTSREPLLLTNASVDSIVKTGNGSLVTSGSATNSPTSVAGPSKTDIENVISAYRTEQVDELVGEWMPEEPAETAAENFTASSAADLLNTPVAETEEQPELPVANQEIVASILQAETEDEVPVAAVLPKATQSVTVSSTDSETAIAETEIELGDTTAAIAEPEIEPADTTAAITETEIEPADTTAAITETEIEPADTTAAITETEIEPADTTAAITETEIEPADTTDAIAETEIEPADNTVAIADTEQLDTTADTAMPETEQAVATAEPDAEVEQQAAPVLVSFEEYVVVESEALPTPTAENDSEVAEVEEVPEIEEVEEVEEVAASSQLIEIDSAAEGIDEIDDTDASSFDTPETTALTEKYVDNVDTDEVDRSQDELADDRPEVFLTSETNGKEKILPEIRFEPRY